MKTQPTVKELLEMLHERVPDFFDRNTKQKEWQDLTDEEITEAVGEPLDSVYLADFHKVIAKLKDKNT